MQGKHAVHHVAGLAEIIRRIAQAFERGAVEVLGDFWLTKTKFFHQLGLHGKPAIAERRERAGGAAKFADENARTLYQDAATLCHSVRDYVTRDLFEKLIHDEEEHIDFLETQIDLVTKLGLELYSQHHIGTLGDDD